MGSESIFEKARKAKEDIDKTYKDVARCMVKAHNVINNFEHIENNQKCLKDLIHELAALGEKFVEANEQYEKLVVEMYRTYQNISVDEMNETNKEVRSNVKKAKKAIDDMLQELFEITSLKKQ